MDVFVGSLWHQDCDPFVTVYATSRDMAQHILDESAHEEYMDLLDSCDCLECEDEHKDNTRCNQTDCECCCEDDVMTSGVFQETVTEEELITAAGWAHSEAYRLQDFYKDGYEYGVY